jgi:hypothetical protein
LNGKEGVPKKGNRLIPTSNPSEKRGFCFGAGEKKYSAL